MTPLKGDNCAASIELCRPPTSGSDQPEPRPKTLGITGKKRVFASLAMKGDEAAHRGQPISSGVLSALLALQLRQETTKFAALSDPPLDLGNM